MRPSNKVFDSLYAVTRFTAPNPLATPGVERGSMDEETRMLRDLQRDQGGLTALGARRLFFQGDHTNDAFRTVWMGEAGYGDYAGTNEGHQ